MSTIGTLSGKIVDLAQPSSRDIEAADIAAGLSRLPRFCGQTRLHYSVAQHSVEVAKLVPEHALSALLHDAAEAYMGDCPRPLKELLGNAWHSIERRLHAAICERFGISNEIPGKIKWADEVMLITENRDLQPNKVGWERGAGWPAPRAAAVVPLPCEQARALWLNALRKALRSSDRVA